MRSGGVEVGVIYQIDDEWLWLITLPGLLDHAGRTESRRAAMQAFRAAWNAEAAQLSSAHAAAAVAAARRAIIC